MDGDATDRRERASSNESAHCAANASTNQLAPGEVIPVRKLGDCVRHGSCYSTDQRT